MLHKFTFLSFFFVFSSSMVVLAQGLGNSPYSRLGVGDVYSSVTNQNIGAGGLGVSTFSKDFIHLMNPALAANKRGLYRDSLVKMEGAFACQYKTLSTKDNSESYFGANLRYFALSVPIGKVWNTTVSMQPFSVKDHNYVQTRPVEGDPLGYSMKQTYDGKGGIYQVAVNNGIGLSKRLSAGLGLSYLFGPATTTTTSLLLDPTDPFQTEYGVKRVVNYSFFGIKPAAHYRKEMLVLKDSVKVPRGVYWNIGATGELFTPLQLKVQESLIRKAPTLNISEDSVVANYTTYGNMPARFNVGFSVDRPNKWMLGIEGGFSNWSDFRYLETDRQQYRLAWNVSVGGEYRPGNSLQWRKWTYRTGFAYARLPYVFSGKQINDISGSLGVTMPVGTRGAAGALLPKINLALVIGQRGTTQNEMAKELYFRLHLGILITDKWFIKRRIQ